MTISDVVAYLTEIKAVTPYGVRGKARSKMSYRGYKRNMAHKLRKILK